MGIYRPPLDCIYAFESRVAAFTYGAAAVPFGVVTAFHISTRFLLRQEAGKGGGNLIGDEEACEIVVSGESVNYRCEGLVLRIRPLRIRLFDLSSEGVDVEEYINPCI